MDYEVLTKVSFRLDFDGNGEMNLLLMPEIRQVFANHVKEVYEQDETLRDYVSGDLNFRFSGSTALLEYTFSCCDENEAEAESFSEYCIREVQEELGELRLPDHSSSVRGNRGGYYLVGPVRGCRFWAKG